MANLYANEKHGLLLHPNNKVKCVSFALINSFALRSWNKQRLFVV